MTVEIGSPAPSFELFDQDRNLVSLESLRGNKGLIVFMPFPFTGICDGESCLIRDRLASLNDVGAEVVVITTHAVPTNKHWAEENGFEFPVLSDYWPHGEVARAYGTFSERGGVAYRSTFVVDGDGLLREKIASDSLGTPREFEAYTSALTAF